MPIVSLVVGCVVYEIFAIFHWNHFGISVLTLRGRRRPKVKVDMGVLGMGSYYCLIVTISLSCTVWPQYKTRQTDGRVRKKSPSYALCIP